MISVNELYEKNTTHMNYFIELSNLIMQAFRNDVHEVEVFLRKDFPLSEYEMYFPDFQNYLIYMRSLGYECKVGWHTDGNEDDAVSYLVKF